jgi:hypothetical protein
MMPFWNGRFSLQAEGARWTSSTPRAASRSATAPIPRGTKFERQAQQFVNITLDADYQIEMTRRLPVPASPSKKAKPPEMAHYALKEADLKAMMLDFAEDEPAPGGLSRPLEQGGAGRTGGWALGAGLRSGAD